MTEEIRNDLSRNQPCSPGEADVRSYNEQRNRRVVVLVERRKSPKKIAAMLNMTIWAVYKIIERNRIVQICPNSIDAENKKVA